MSVENQTRTTDDHDEDVIIIEEKSKTRHWVAGVTLIIGAITGGLIGSSLSDNKWSAAYTQLEAKYDRIRRRSQLHFLSLHSGINEVFQAV